MTIKTTGRLDRIKRINRSLILETIRENHPIDTAKIAEKINVSHSTVSSIVDKLIEKRLVIDLENGVGVREGRRREVGYNPKSAFALGVDIGGTKILIVVTDLDGCIILREKRETSGNVADIVYIIKQCILKSNVPEKEIVAMGVGVPGITNTAEGIVIEAPALKWKNLRLKEQLEEHFHFPVFINNDVNCLALGERWLGSGKKSDDLFFIAIGTGVGSAIISNGELIQGFNYQSGEIGYYISSEDIQNGQFNMSSSEYGVFEKKTNGASLTQFGYSSKELLEEYEKGNQQVAPVIENFILQLSIIITNVINLLNPERVIIGGGVSESLGAILEQIRDSVDRFTPIKTTIELSSLGSVAAGLGAVAYALNEVHGEEH